MRLIHVSDIHLENDGAVIWETDTLRHFNKAIDIIKKIDNVDVIIVSGDLANDGSKWAYEYIDKSFESIGIPTLCCPGNHDSLSMMYKGYIPSFYKTDNKLFICGYKILMLNSVIPDEENPMSNKSRGMLSEDVLSFLSIEIKEDVPTIIVLHHPPLEPGGWLNRKLLDNREQFINLISGHSNVKLVLYGHIHCSMQHNINEIMFSSAPSVGFAFDKDLPKFQIANGKEGINIIDISGSNISIKSIFFD